MFAADCVWKSGGLEESARVRAVFVLGISFTILRQDNCHGR
jgi:hypothetical protein